MPTKLILDGGKKVVTDPVELFIEANSLARRNGVGRIDIVENRFIGIKSRGCYETPGLTILRTAHVDLEGLTLDREVRALRDQFVTVTYSKLLYNGMYFTPECEYVRAMIPPSQITVNGTVRARAYKGSVSVLGRFSETEKLYDETESSMDELTVSPLRTPLVSLLCNLSELRSSVSLPEMLVESWSCKYTETYKTCTIN